MKTIVSSEWIKTIFLYGVIAFMAYMTFNAVHGVTGDWIVAALSIFLFDGGAYAGYRMLTGHAGGQHQRTTAKVILWIDFILAVGMIAGNLHLVAPDFVKWLVVLAACVNGWALYYYETHDPEFMEIAQEQDEADAQVEAARRNRRGLYKKAMKRAEATINHQSRELGDLMAYRAAAQLKYDMRLPMTEAEAKAWNEDIIEGDAIPALPDNETAPRGYGIADFLSLIFGRLAHTGFKDTPSVQVEQPSPTPSPEPEPDQPPTA